MGKTKSMTRDQNHDDASIRKNWSDLNHDVLFLVMMQLGVVDFLAFSRVCKSWRSLALSNKNKFIVSRPPMAISISNDANENEWYLYLEDSQGIKFKTILPAHSDYKQCIGVSCGYLILIGEETNDLWLVNPITRHEFHAPFPFLDIRFYIHGLGVILVFSPSISAWVFVVINRFWNKIWFCIAGKREWTCVFTPLSIYDLHVFKGKIYALHPNNFLSEVRLFPTPKVTLLEIKNFSTTERKMEWVSPEKTGEEYAFFLSTNNGAFLIRIEPWADLYSQYSKYSFPAKNGKDRNYVLLIIDMLI
ncbi:unnamed protein product [Lactuca virosa]|uniref:F-box domain-containing protein n=1 Tax=Lactuca virosa TaxID=75947 RepID=A0AAU9PJP5_9ASTR|nr:unnamed protein product [Lactuca virosa]